jgi:hypothetical protein
MVDHHRYSTANPNPTTPGHSSYLVVAYEDVYLGGGLSDFQVLWAADILAHVAEDATFQASARVEPIPEAFRQSVARMAVLQAAQPQ